MFFVVPAYEDCYSYIILPTYYILCLIFYHVFVLFHIDVLLIIPVVVISLLCLLLCSSPTVNIYVFLHITSARFSLFYLSFFDQSSVITSSAHCPWPLNSTCHRSHAAWESGTCYFAYCPLLCFVVFARFCVSGRTFVGSPLWFIAI